VADPSGHPLYVNVVPGAEPIRLDVELEPMARLSGRVLDSARQPMENANVELRLLDEIVMVTRAGKDGAFTFQDIIPGKWTIQAIHRTGVRAADSESQSWESDPEQIQIRPGQQLSGYDIRTRIVPVFKVSGEVLDPSGSAVQGITVETRESRGPTLTLEATKVTDADGRFEVSLRPGVWVLTAHDGGPLKWYGAATITLARADIPDVRIRISTRFKLPVIVEGAPPGKTDLYIVPSDLPLDQMRSVRTQPDGSLAISDIAPGRYRIKVLSVPSGTYLESIFFGEQDVLGREVDLYEGSPPLRLVCKMNPVTAHGTVESGPNAQVVFLPQEELLRGD
jgi:carboxypeptidase family protein/uncharacterized protein DUF1416